MHAWLSHITIINKNSQTKLVQAGLRYLWGQVVRGNQDLPIGVCVCRWEGEGREVWFRVAHARARHCAHYLPLVPSFLKYLESLGGLECPIERDTGQWRGNMVCYGAGGRYWNTEHLHLSHAPKIIGEAPASGAPPQFLPHLLTN